MFFITKVLKGKSLTVCKLLLYVIIVISGQFTALSWFLNDKRLEKNTILTINGDPMTIGHFIQNEYLKSGVIKASISGKEENVP